SPACAATWSGSAGSSRCTDEDQVMRVLHVAAVLASCGMPMPAIAQDEATWASRLDYTLNESRDKPIVCKQGDIERHAGQTLAQVFAEKWPVQPEPLPGSERVQAQATRAIRPRGAMRGMPVQPGIVVFAVLVDENGEPVQAEVLCASTEGYDKYAMRIALQSQYKPALVNGKPVTSVVVHVQKFAGGAG
ncbi:MAG TPA: energy transducer TonB, partial [Thermomonas sp.]|nr:energy transducer TonB [Thermomonas sp.]